jgi:hypothetical protein
MKIFRFVGIILGLMLLSGCSSMGSEMMNSVSSKHDGSLMKGGESKTAAVANKNCNQWCHNGWCSTHCEPVATGN